MTIDEIFSKLGNHAINGVMAHESFANYYDFLGLKGYKKCHEYHFEHEMKNYRKICKYYINHYDKLMPEYVFTDPGIIPSSWYEHKRQDIDVSTLQKSVKDGLEKWIAWEEQTKALYESLYTEALNIGEVATANLIMCFVCDVDKELEKAKRYELEKSATGYSIASIISDQDIKHKKYSKMLNRD